MLYQTIKTDNYLKSQGNFSGIPKRWEHEEQRVGVWQVAYEIFKAIKKIEGR